MADILLPPNATPLEKACEQAMAVYGDARDPGVADVWRPDTCPPAILPWLAWALSIRRWDAAWSVEVQRQAIADALAVHRLAGTRRVVEDSLAALGAEIVLSEQRSAAVAATLTVDGAFRITAVTPGAAGNGVTVEVASGAAVAVDVVDNAITVTVSPGSTVDQVVAALAADADAAALVSAAVEPGADPDAEVAAAAMQALAGGADAHDPGFRMRVEIYNSVALLSSGLREVRDQIQRVKRVSVHETIVAVGGGGFAGSLALVGAVGAVVVPPTLELRAGA